MADPLSIASSAIGIISLGIQVCEGIVSYLRSVKGRKQEITEALKEIQSLLTIFSSLNDILPEIERGRYPESATIRACLRDNEEELLGLQRMLNDLGPIHASETKHKVKEFGSTLIHHFRREKLSSLRQSGQKLLSHLQLALEIASLYEALFLHRSV